ncbi:MAG: hypothetical protein WC496_11695 [Phycisphaerae bacterium]|jgi:Tfp pilus assembly protein PilV
MRRQKYKYHTIKRFGRAFSFLELQVTMVILAIGLWGFAGLFKVYSRQVDYIEQSSLPVSTYYIVSQSNQWMKQLGSPAEIKQTPGQVPWTPQVDGNDVGDYSVAMTSSPAMDFDLNTAVVNIHVEQ